MSKQYRVKFAISSARSAGPLEHVHTDLWGPASVLVRKEVRYFMTLIDNLSKQVWMYFLMKKSEAFLKFKI